LEAIKRLRNSFIKYSPLYTSVWRADFSASANGINYTPQKLGSLFHAQLPCGGGGEILNVPDLSKSVALEMLTPLIEN
jgi:hypothetical protein